MTQKKHYMLTLVKLVNPSIDFPIFIERTGLFSYQYHITHAEFYGTKLSKWRGLLHILLFKLMPMKWRTNIFKNRKANGKLILQEMGAKNSSQKCS